MTPRDLLLGALNRMIESVQDDMKQEAGNHMTLAALQGELKGLMASRAYAANVIPSAPTEVAPPGCPNCHCSLCRPECHGLRSPRGEPTLQATVICSNCGTRMPEGCGGQFRKDGHACLLNRPEPQEQPSK